MTKARTTSPLTRNQKKKMSEVPSEVKLRKIVPEVPRDEAERGELLEDLQVMGCSGFLEKPWGFKDDRIVRELLDGVSNEFDNSIRGQPIRWTATPICPFLYHLYERKELLKPEEEKSWKIQEGMLKYGESGSEDEGGSGSGSEDESDDKEEEEEET
jgi:hypothetical protein